MSESRRVLTMLEVPLYKRVAYAAKRDGMSLSQKVRDLLDGAVERDEDADLVRLVAHRKKKQGKFLSLKQVKKRYGW